MLATSDLAMERMMQSLHGVIAAEVEQFDRIAVAMEELGEELNGAAGRAQAAERRERRAHAVSVSLTDAAAPEDGGAGAFEVTFPGTLTVHEVKRFIGTHVAGSRPPAGRVELGWGGDGGETVLDDDSAVGDLWERDLEAGKLADGRSRPRVALWYRYSASGK